jgi:hypothetical protein
MLTLMYILFAVIGCGYIVVSGLLGHLFEFGDGGNGDGHAVDATHAEAASPYGLDGTGHGTASAESVGGVEFHFPFFSPLALSTLFAAVGAYGLIARYGLHVEDETSLLIAVPAALVTAYAITYVGWKLVVGARATGVIRLAQLAGAPAEVTTPIPAGGLGEAVAMVGGQRYTAAAREVEGREVRRGAPVTVVSMTGSTLVVRADRKPEGSFTHG